MRPPRTAVLLFLLVVVGYALVGFVVIGVATGAASGAAPAETVTASEQVTDEDGRPVADAFVLVEPSAVEDAVTSTPGGPTDHESPSSTGPPASAPEFGLVWPVVALALLAAARGR